MIEGMKTDCVSTSPPTAVGGRIRDKGVTYFTPSACTMASIRPSHVYVVASAAIARPSCVARAVVTGLMLANRVLLPNC